VSRPLRPERPDTPPVDVAHLLDSRRPQLVLALTDGVGPAWANDTALYAARRFARVAPTAIVADVAAGELAANGSRGHGDARGHERRDRAQHADPGDTERFDRGDARRHEARPCRFPVLALKPDPLRDWRSFVAGGTGIARQRTFRWSSPGRKAPGQGGFSSQIGEPPPARRHSGARLVDGVSAPQARPRAFELATRLAAAPLNGPIMHAIQHAACRGASAPPQRGVRGRSARGGGCSPTTSSWSGASRSISVSGARRGVYSPTRSGPRSLTCSAFFEEHLRWHDRTPARLAGALDNPGSVRPPAVDRKQR